LVAGLHVLHFTYAVPEEVREALRGLSHLAKLDEGSDFFFFSELDGEPPFKLDCELIDLGLITDRKGAYESFLGALCSALTAKFGKVRE
jgi:hypothetical protein